MGLANQVIGIIIKNLHLKLFRSASQFRFNFNLKLASLVYI